MVMSYQLVGIALPAKQKWVSNYTQESLISI